MLFRLVINDDNNNNNNNNNINNNNNNFFDLKAFLQVPTHLQIKSRAKKKEYKFIILKLRTEKSNPTCVTVQLWLRLYNPEQHHFVKKKPRSTEKLKIMPARG